MDRKEFENLSPEEQARVFHESHSKERAELLLYSSEPAGLTQSLPPEELYLLTREMDPEERTEVVCYASMPQLVFLSDLDCWKKDRLSARGFLGWLETLHTADEKRLLAWFETTDYEMLIAGMQKIIHVLKPDREYAADELLKDRPYFTLDQYYYVFVKEENLETVKRVLETLYENHQGRYVALLEGVMGELDAEMEEDAYRLRQMRLSERGFVDAESARTAFRPITREEYDKTSPKGASAAKDAGERSAHYPALWRGEKLLLDDAMEMLSAAPESDRERLNEEFVWLSNKAISLDGIDFASEERVRRGIERVRHLVNVGLESLCGSDVRAAADTLRTRWVEAVMRWGATRLYEARGEARELVEYRWKDQTKPFYEFMGPPFEGIFRGLLRTLPEFHDAEAGAETEELRDFRTMGEVERTRQAVRQAKQIFGWLERRLPHLFRRGVFLRGKAAGAPVLIALLGTAFARWAADGKLSEKPLAGASIEAFFERALSGASGRRSVSAAVAREFLDVNLSVEERGLLEPVWEHVFSRIGAEIGGLSGPDAVDARFVTSLAVFQRTAS